MFLIYSVTFAGGKTSLTFQCYSCCDPQIHHHKREFLIHCAVILDFLSLFVSQLSLSVTLSFHLSAHLFALSCLLPPTLTKSSTVALLVRNTSPLGEKNGCCYSFEASHGLQRRATALIREKDRVRGEIKRKRQS